MFYLNVQSTGQGMCQIDRVKVKEPTQPRGLVYATLVANRVILRKELWLKLMWDSRDFSRSMSHLNINVSLLVVESFQWILSALHLRRNCPRFTKPKMIEVHCLLRQPGKASPRPKTRANSPRILTLMLVPTRHLRNSREYWRRTRDCQV